MIRRHGRVTSVSLTRGTVLSSPDGGWERRKRLAAVALGGALVTTGLWLVIRELGGIGDRKGRGADAGTAVEKTITVGKPADELHELWRDTEELGRIMAHFAEVTSVEEGRQHWEVRSPVERSVSWDAEIVEDRPGELLRWKSVEGADVPNEGEVRLRDAPADRGTEVTLSIRFDPPDGPFGDAASEYLGVVPEVLTRKALRRFKSLAETGEIPTLESNPSARGRGDVI